MEGICLTFIDLTYFSPSSRDVAMTTNFGQNWRIDLHQHAGALERITISPFQFKSIQWQYPVQI